MANYRQQHGRTHREEERRVRAAREAVFAALPSDPKYAQLDARRAKLIRESVVAENILGADHATARRARRLATLACRRAQRYEDAALLAAGLKP